MTNKQMTFNNISEAINNTVGINSKHEFVITLTARLPYGNHITAVVATVETYEEANRLYKEFKTNYATELENNEFYFTFYTAAAHYTKSGQTSNRAYDHSKRY